MPEQLPDEAVSGVGSEPIGSDAGGKIPAPERGWLMLTGVPYMFQ